LENEEKRRLEEKKEAEELKKLGRNGPQSQRM